MNPRAYQLKLLFFTLVSLFLIFTIIDSINQSQSILPIRHFEATDYKATDKYQCPPCGCKSDQKVLYTEGKCESCRMTLHKINPSLLTTIGNYLAPLFRTGMTNRIVFNKLLFPAFLISIILAFIVVLKFRDKIANVFLAMFVISLSSYALNYHLNHLSEILDENYKYLFFPISLLTISAGLIYLYTDFYLHRKKRFAAKDWLHFSPALLMFLIYLPLYFDNGPAKYDLMVTPSIFVPSHLEQLIFLGLAFFYLNRIQHMLAGSASIAKEELHWIQQLSLGFKLMVLVWTYSFIANVIFYDMGMVIITYYPVWFAMAVFIYWMMIQLLLKPKLINYKALTVVSKRNLTEDEINIYTQQLYDLMENEKLYLDSELNLEKLAQHLLINIRDLSVILNHGVGKSFYDFINEYRIKEVKTKLLDPTYQNLTNEAIASEAGFSSKSAFHSSFKKYVHMTPNDFKKSYTN